MSVSDSHGQVLSKPDKTHITFLKRRIILGWLKKKTRTVTLQQVVGSAKDHQQGNLQTRKALDQQGQKRAQVVKALHS